MKKSKDKQWNYLYRREIPSNEEGFKSIQIRVNEDPNIKGYPKLVTLSSGRFFFPFSIKDLKNLITELKWILKEASKIKSESFH